jgi:hypothetical protein
MKVLAWILCVCAMASLPVLSACEQAAAAKVPVEKLPDVKPSLPPVPTIPPPKQPVQYSDQSYSVEGLRKVKNRTLNSEVNVTAYIAKVFTPPECPPNTKCPLPSAPHIWLADSKGETDSTKLLLVAGYAENQKSIDEAMKDAKRGKKAAVPPEDTGLIPIPVDLFQDAKIKIKGRFSFMSGAGFSSSAGVLDYLGHEILEPGTPPPPPPKEAKKRR